MAIINIQDNAFQTYFKDIDASTKLRILIVSKENLFFFFIASVPYSVTTLTRSFLNCAFYSSNCHFGKARGHLRVWKNEQRMKQLL